MAQGDITYVEVERSGGQLPLYRPRYRVEKKDLSAQEQQLLGRLVEQADFFNLPAQFSPVGHPDAFEYRLTVQQSGKDRTLTFHDDDGHPQSLDELVDWVKNRKP